MVKSKIIKDMCGNMLINNIFKKDESINIQTYLNKLGVKDVGEYLQPTGKYIEQPFIYNNMKKAVALFIEHYIYASPTYILVDPDVDGFTSATIMYRYMKKINPKWDIKFLLHEGKARGLDDIDVLNKVLTDKRRFLIIPDANTNCKESTRKVFNNGTDVLVLEHHDIEDPIDCGILVTNQVGDVDRQGSGCLVTQKFLEALDLELEIDYAKNFIDLTALSLLADSMDITSMQNREYLHYGFFIENCIKNKFLSTLINKFIAKDNYTQKDLSFSIVPKLNACIRTKDQKLKQRTMLALLDMDNLDEVAKLCSTAHNNQKNTVNDVVDNNIDNVNKNDSVVFLITDDVPENYSGLLAGRLSTICMGKPCIVGKIKNGIMIGSLRSPIPLRELLNETNLAQASGHSGACGIVIKQENIEPLIQCLNNTVDYKPQQNVIQSYNIKEIPNYLFTEFIGYDTIWNDSFLPIPQVHIKSFILNSKDIQLIGKNKTTIKFTKDGLTFIKFYCNQEFKDKLFLSDKQNHRLQIEIIGELGVNTYNGNSSNQCVINHIEVTEKNINTIDDIF